MTRFDAGPVLAGLKDFQRATVEHVARRFFADPQPTRRFLVADETGLGKSVVARGVIAKTLEHLQDDDSVDRIDVVYICSNADIARQNLARLEVTGSRATHMSTRLTMLAMHTASLNGAASDMIDKPVNLVAFTPGTSFEQGWRTGQAEERALIYLLLEEQLGLSGWARRSALQALRATTRSYGRFEDVVENLRWTLNGGPDPVIAEAFGRGIKEDDLARRAEELFDDVGRRHELSGELRQRATGLIGELRGRLARASIESLEPDLVILDEFQRFKNLLSVEQGGESAELARELFDYGQAKVLLLSATPYKPFTLEQERLATGESHHKDFLETLRFLNGDPDWLNQVDGALADYRDALSRAASASESAGRVRELLTTVMTRAERPRLGTGEMVQERRTELADLTADDVRGYVRLRELASALDANATLEYWKSAPYFINFVEGYQLGDKLKKALADGVTPGVRELAARTQQLDTAAISSFKPMDLGNARLRRLAEDTVDKGWAELLWLPPSMPYFTLGAPFAQHAAAGITKRLIFSSWSATPTAIAGLLSYEAERRIAGDVLTENSVQARASVASRLDYRLDDGRPAAMSALALFWPHPELARLGDPLTVARSRPGEMLSAAQLEGLVRDALQVSSTEEGVPEQDGDTAVWGRFFAWPGALPDDVGADLLPLLAGSSAEFAPGASQDDVESRAGLSGHVEQALRTIASGGSAGLQRRNSLARDVVRLAVHAPGNIAWRALARVLDERDDVTAGEHWRAAAHLAAGLRSLFNRLESTLIIGQGDGGGAYWRAVLKYCAAGNLQAVLDEYVHHLRSSLSDAPLTGETLFDLADDMVSALTLRVANYGPYYPLDEHGPRLRSRFALRYGSARGTAADAAEGVQARQQDVRSAFNSPFWPFVLATTSAGQEGIDFHWWCSAIVHWNTPANPVDFEQREGRVHRFGGHAVRRNVAAAHREEALSSEASDPWKAAYDAANEATREQGDFAPYWVYGGDAKIERHVYPYALSLDGPRYDRLKRDLALYRLAFGQPRQEDLLKLLDRRSDEEIDATDVIDLRAPSRVGHGDGL
ncbi:C-terminal helicase domain-containing protein [Modestobacter excelsi]|uniref:C-terminal helicase domain-containing protein n=1 Tax=Modestobacter excelsi TaxID=2213161 RepID=UPI00110C96C2|nr:helicase-related protein [Modestobacter excelsi]